MKKITLFSLIVKMSMKDQFRQVKRNIMLFLIPIGIFLFIYGFFTYNKVEETFFEPITIGFVQKDRSMYADILSDGLMNTQSFSKFVTILEGEEDELNEAFDQGKLDAQVVMPKDFVKSVMRFSYNPIQIKIYHREPLRTLLIKNIALGYEKYITSVETGVMTLYDQMETEGFSEEEVLSYNEQISYDLIFTALGRDQLLEYVEIINIPSTSSAIYYFIAIVVLFLMYIPVYSSIGIIRERENMCLFRLKVLGAELSSYFLAKALSVTLFVFSFVMGWVALLFIFMRNAHFSSFLQIGLFVMIGIFFNVAFVMLVSGFIESEDGVVLFCNIFIFFNAIIGGSIIPLQMMPEGIARLGIASPGYWMIRGLLYIQAGVNLKESLLISSFLLCAGMSMLMVTSKLYKKSW